MTAESLPSEADIERTAQVISTSFRLSIEDARAYLKHDRQMARKALWKCVCSQYFFEHDRAGCRYNGRPEGDPERCRCMKFERDLGEVQSR